MQKAEPQHNQAQSQPAQRQGKGASLESPQGEQIAQLEAMAESSPQSGRLAQLAAMADASPALAAQRRMMDMIHNSPRMAAQRKAADAMHHSPNVAVQRQQLDGLAEATAQEADEPLQAKVAQRAQAPNNTGLPDNLKSGIESLSGMSMDNVKVHYNSSQPAQLNAHAYAQGSDIHIAPGQERHLPHEAWHVVQQAQGRVRPTMQMKGDVPVNDDAGLEHEADVMGGAASVGGAQGKSIESASIDIWSKPNNSISQLFVSPEGLENLKTKVGDTQKEITDTDPKNEELPGGVRWAGTVYDGAVRLLNEWKLFHRMHTDHDYKEYTTHFGEDNAEQPDVYTKKKRGRNIYEAVGEAKHVNGHARQIKKNMKNAFNQLFTGGRAKKYGPTTSRYGLVTVESNSDAAKRIKEEETYKNKNPNNMFLDNRLESYNELRDECIKANGFSGKFESEIFLGAESIWKK